MADLTFKKGDIIFREGDSGYSFFKINSGKVAAYTNYGENDELKLRDMEPGEFFGEMAALEGYHRSATVVAEEDNTSVTEITEKENEAYFSKNPEQIIIIMRQISARIRELTKDYNEVTAAINELEGAEPKKPSENLLSKIKKFLNGRTYETTAEEIEIALQNQGYNTASVKSYPAGTIIFREGDEGNCMYAIHFGRVGIYTGYGTPQEKMITDLYRNKFFGEMSMIDQEPRSATAVVLDDDTTLETIYPEDLIDLMEKNPPEVNMILNHLSNRLRRLTIDYVNACQKLKEMSM